MKTFRLGIIYKITNKLNGKAYVGKSVKHRLVRFAEHVKDASKGSTLALHRAIRKYGPKNFRVRVLKRVTEPSLNLAEIHFIARHGTFGRGYNMTRGGDGCPADKAVHRRQGRSLRKFYELHPEVLVAMSRRALKFYSTVEGRRCAETIAKTLTGFKHNKLTRRNMTRGLLKRYEDVAAHAVTSEAMLKAYRSPAGKVTKAKQSAAGCRRAATGEYHSLAARKVLSEKATLQWVVKRDVMMKAMQSWDHTPSKQVRRKISTSLKKAYATHPELGVACAEKMRGRKASLKTRAAQSIGIRAAWAAKTDEERAQIGLRRSVGVTKYYDRVGRKPKTSAETRANTALGACKRRAAHKVYV